MPCHDELCFAINNIVCAIQADDAIRTPNTMVYRTPEAAQQARELYRHEIRALGREHPERFPLYCKLIAGIAAMVDGENDPRQQDAFIAENLVDMALRVDRPPYHCLAAVKRVVPDTPRARFFLSGGERCLSKISSCQKTMLNPKM